MQIRKTALRAMMATALFMGATACDDDGSVKDDGGGADDDGGMQEGGSPDGGSGADSGVTDPVYALVTQVFGASGDENVSYVMLSDSLDQVVDPEDAVISLPGRAIGFGPDEGGKLFLGGDTAPEPGGSAATIVRYDLRKDGTLEKFGAEVTFAGKGVTEIGEYPGQFHFASAEKAYYFDGNNAQIIVWNPRAMKVEDDLPLDELVIQGNVLTFSAMPVVQGEVVYTFAGWRSMTGIPSQAAVVALDTDSDDVTVVTDDRCGYVRDGVLAEDGYIYLATENYASAVHRLNEASGPAPCLLRFDPEAGEFDPDFHVELNELFDGDTAGSLLAGPGGKAFIGVLDETAVAIDEMTHPRVLASAAGAWRWASLTLGDEPEGSLLSIAPGNGSIVPQLLGGDLYVPQFSGGGPNPYETELREVTEDGPGATTGGAPGLVFSAVKLR